MERIFISSLIILVSLLLAKPESAFGQENTRRVAVTFDDLPFNSLSYYDVKEWHEINTRLLTKIKAFEIPAVGFVNEGKLYQNDRLDTARIELLRLWLRNGIELGNHTFTHKDLHRVSAKEFREDVINGEKITRLLLTENGKALRYFRHPYLHTGRELQIKHDLEKFLNARGYTIAPVTIDNSEWIFARAYDNACRDNDTLKMYQVGEEYIAYMDRKFAYYEQQSIALLGYEMKQILVLHINRLNADYFDQLAEKIQSRGYSFITLKEALADSAYNSADTYTGPGGITWIHRWAITAGKTGDFFAGEPLTPEYIMKLAGVESE